MPSREIRVVRRRCGAVIAALCVTAIFNACAGGPGEGLVFVLPSPTLAATPVYVAEDLGLFRDEGLTVELRYAAGVAAPNAVLAGSADFTLGAGPTFLGAAARGQRFFAIANTIDRPLVEFVVGTDAAQRVGITPDLPLDERARRLRGMTIAVHGLGGSIHAWQRYVVRAGGLDVDRDVRVTPMEPTSMLAALRSHAIDGFVTSMPFTTQALQNGEAIIVASALRDAPELLPFAYGLIYTVPETCQTRRHVCAGMARAFAAAARVIAHEPDRVYEAVLEKRFPSTPEALLREAWEQTRQPLAIDIRVTDQQLQNAERIGAGALLIEPASIRSGYDSLFTDEFLR